MPEQKNVYNPKEHVKNEKNETMKATENPKPAAPTKPKKATEISGYDSQSSLRHIHCPKCGKIITHAPYSRDFVVPEERLALICEFFLRRSALESDKMLTEPLNSGTPFLY